jgi:hypothetical protein
VTFPLKTRGCKTEAQFLVPDHGIRLSYRPASLCSLVGMYDNPMTELTISPQSGTKNLATEFGMHAGGRGVGLRTCTCTYFSSRKAEKDYSPVNYCKEISTDFPFKGREAVKQKGLYAGGMVD